MTGLQHCSCVAAAWPGQLLWQAGKKNAIVLDISVLRRTRELRTLRMTKAAAPAIASSATTATCHVHMQGHTALVSAVCLPTQCSFLHVLVKV